VANRIETLKTEKDGLDVWPDLLRYAREGTPIEAIPEDDLERMKWYGVFHRKQTPGYFMMRLRTPGGRLSSDQLRVLAAVARDFGHGTADLTTRENVQLRGLRLPDVPVIIERLASVGISTRQSGMDNVRNIVSCPLAGIDAAEVLDTADLALELQRALLDAGKAYSNLPRKLNVAITGCREDCAQSQTHDLAFVPATCTIDNHHVAGFNVLVGGALGGTSPRLAEPLDVFLRPDEVVPFFLALLTVFREHGRREQRTKARLKWLLDEWGARILRRAVQRELPFRLARAGRLALTRVAGDHIGIHYQRQLGLKYVGLHVPVGRITADQTAELARIADEYGTSEVRLTVDQNLVLPNVTAARLPRLLHEPLLQALSPAPDGVWRHLVACTGNDYCHFSHIDTKGTALALARELEARGVRTAAGTRIHISGCVHACGKHRVGDIGIVGTPMRVGEAVVAGVDLFAGGCLGNEARLATVVAEGVSLDALTDRVQELLLARGSQAARGAEHQDEATEEATKESAA